MKTERNDSATVECPALEIPTALSNAMDFYRAALKEGPRLAREVVAEGKRQGHTKRTQERARARLHVQKIPPTTWQGPWMIALPDDPAVEAARSGERRSSVNDNSAKATGGGRSRKTKGATQRLVRC